MVKCREQYHLYKQAIEEKYHDLVYENPYIAEYIDQMIEEGSKRTTMTRVTRQTKIDRALGNLATKYAKEVNDPMYHKMKKFRDKFFKFRERIKAKYGPRVRSRAISGGGITDLIKKAKKEDKK
jgi:hypothetical protein